METSRLASGKGHPNMWHVSGTPAGILRIDTNPRHRHQRRERTQKELPYREKGENKLRRTGIHPTDATSRQRKGDIEGTPIEWGEVGISDRRVQTRLKIQTLTNTTQQAAEGKTICHQNARRKENQKPGNARTNEVWKTNPEH